MSAETSLIRNSLEHSLDALELLNWNNGFAAAVEGIEQLSDLQHNKGNTEAAETLRWAAKELRGENVI
jgi:hypothetical protein